MNKFNNLPHRDNQNGLTLISVLVGFGLLGILSLGVMKMTKNMSDSNVRSNASYEITELKRYISMLIQHENHCRVSLAPISSFRKRDHDEINDTSEGIEIGLYMSNQAGTSRQGTAKLSRRQKYNRLTINSLKLYLSNNPGTNYSSGYHHDIGQIVVRVQRKTSGSTTRQEMLKIPVSLMLETSSGRTKVSSCYQHNTDIKTASLEIYGLETRESSSNWFVNVKCPSNMIATGFCSSGANKDCRPGSLTKSILCKRYKGDIVLQTSEHMTKIGWYGNHISCPPFHAIVKLCTSGKNIDCRNNYYRNSTTKMTNSVQTIICAPIKPTNSTLVNESHQWFYEHNWHKNISCPNGQYLTGICSSGEKRDCWGNTKAARCTKLNP